MVRSASEFIVGPRFARTRWRVSNHEMREWCPKKSPHTLVAVAFSDRAGKVRTKIG
jgi:hypothetical protein